MALSDDQKAMLRLLAQREQGYDDIAALMGLSVDEVRSKVKDALAELDQSAAEAPAAEKTPPPPPPPVPKPAEPAEPAAPPAAQAAPKPAESRESEPKPAEQKSPPSAPRVSRPGLPKDQGALRGLIAGAAVVLVIVLLLVTGVFGGGGDGSGGSSNSETTSGETTSAETTSGETASGEGTPSTGGKQPTQAVLKAVNGGGATGQALFGRSERQVVLLIVARGLKPSPAGQSYTVSLARSAGERLPLIATKVDKAGVISGRFRVATEVLGLLAAGFDEMEVSLVPDGQLKVALAQAKNSKKAPEYGGETVLSGPVTGPIVEAGKKG